MVCPRYRAATGLAVPGSSPPCQRPRATPSPSRPAAAAGPARTIRNLPTGNRAMQETAPRPSRHRPAPPFRRRGTGGHPASVRGPVPSIMPPIRQRIRARRPRKAKRIRVRISESGTDGLKRPERTEGSGSRRWIADRRLSTCPPGGAMPRTGMNAADMPAPRPRLSQAAGARFLRPVRIRRR